MAAPAPELEHLLRTDATQVLGALVRDSVTSKDSLVDDPFIRQRERAVRAHLLELDGNTQHAAELFREAATLTGNLAERRYLQGRAQHLES
jgi:predicted RNA polymerase sigma factor